MSNGSDPALIFHRDAPGGGPGTHVLVIGVGKYRHGKGQTESPVGGDLRQLSSPPISARSMADWFIREFQNPQRPLVTVSLLISEEPAQAYRPPVSGGQDVNLVAADLENVKKAARHWADRLKSHRDNMAVFYFCGHGASLGQQAALLLEDFGEPGAEFEGAIDCDILRGTMKNSPAIQQVYLLDCCRTEADDLYRNEPSIGSRIVSIPSFERGHSTPSQQFVLFPTIDGEQAFGIQNQVSVFSGSLIDALSFAAADISTGVWRTTTANLLSAVDQLVRHRVPQQLIQRSKPNALDATSFEFNRIEEPTATRSFVTISDLDLWGDVEVECADPAGTEAPQKQHSRDVENETCCAFELNEGRWRFSGSLPASPPNIKSHERILRVPVAYVTLEVTP